MEPQTTHAERRSKKAPMPKRMAKIKSKDTNRVDTDVLLSIHSVHLANIVSREKNHEYRKYRLRDGVERLWLYETAANGGSSSITHIAVIPGSERRTPGSVPTEPFGIGNADFNAGLKESKFGYPILELYELVKPVARAEMKSEWDMNVPVAWCYLKPGLWMDRWGNDEDKDEKVKKVF